MSQTSTSLANARVLSKAALDPSQSRWVRLSKITYQDANKQTRVWESAERQTRYEPSAVDGVGIVTILEGQDGPRILLQKQYRPPVDKICIEVPAGLVDPNEGPIKCAIRELREETGYVGEVDDQGWGIGPVMYNDPGFCNTNLHMIHVKVDMSSPENQKPAPQLEESEFIECFSVPLNILHQECRRLEEEGYAIDARVGTLAEGIELAKKWRLV